MLSETWFLISLIWFLKHVTGMTLVAVAAGVVGGLNGFSLTCLSWRRTGSGRKVQEEEVAAAEGGTEVVVK